MLARISIRQGSGGQQPAIQEVLEIADFHRPSHVYPGLPVHSRRIDGCPLRFLDSVRQVTRDSNAETRESSQLKVEAAGQMQFVSKTRLPRRPILERPSRFRPDVCCRTPALRASAPSATRSQSQPSKAPVPHHHHLAKTTATISLRTGCNGIRYLLLYFLSQLVWKTCVSTPHMGER